MIGKLDDIESKLNTLYTRADNKLDEIEAEEAAERARKAAAKK